MSGKVGVGLQRLQDCSADAVFSFEKPSKTTPEVRQRASAFVFSVTRYSATWKKCRHSLLSFEVRRLALSLTMSHAPTSLGNRKARLHNLLFPPLLLFQISPHKGERMKGFLAGSSGLQSSSDREWRLLRVIYQLASALLGVRNRSDRRPKGLNARGTHSHGCPLHDQVLIPTALLTKLGSKRLDPSSGILTPSSLRRERQCECFSNEGHGRSGGTCSSGGRAGFSTRMLSTQGLGLCRGCCVRRVEARLFDRREWV